MVHWSLFLLPLVCASVGWCIQYVVLQLLFRNRGQYFRKRLAGTSSVDLQSKNSAILANIIRQQSALLPELLADKEGGAFEQLQPFIEEHIDTFLRVKLKEQIPMIGSLIGERTIAQLKQVFMQELKELFPGVMQQYLQNLQSNVNVEKFAVVIREKLASVDFNMLAHESLRTEKRQFKLVGAAIGFISGSIALFTTLAFL